MPFFQCVLIFSLLLVPCISYGEGSTTRPNSAEAIRVQNMLDDIHTLSSSQFEGRQAGTEGGKRSADFVARRMEQLGLAPAELNGTDGSSTWFQERPISAIQVDSSPTLQFSVVSGNNHQLVLTTPTFGTDFLPILDSPSVNVTAPVVFVGYGIDDPAHGINDYQGLNVQNRIVLFLRGKPTTYSQWVTHEEKVKTAKEHNAAGFITLTGPLLNRYEARRGLGYVPLAIYSGAPDERPLPGIWISGNVGTSIFGSQQLSLKDIQTQLNEGKPFSLKDLGIIAHLQWDSRQSSGKLINVLGAIPGHDPVLCEEIILIGAHRDHFGKQAGLLFAGADDNASGTALLLELARIMAKRKADIKRTIVFASFDGEEYGLLGSKLYAQNPTHPLNKIVTMINIDHIGIGNGKLTVGLTRLPKSIGKRASELSGLTEQTNLYGYFPGGDHVPFYEAEIPTATVVSSGKHPHFHQPSDTSDTIRPTILKNATRYALALVWLLTNTHKEDLIREPSPSDSRS